MPVIKKAIQLKALLWVEGEGEAAQDFAAMTTKAVADALKTIRIDAPQPLAVTVKKVVEYSSDDEEDDAS